MVIINKSTNNKCWWGCGEKGTLVHCWECRLVQSLWKTEWNFLRKLKMDLPHDIFFFKEALTLSLIFLSFFSQISLDLRAEHWQSHTPPLTGHCRYDSAPGPSLSGLLPHVPFSSLCLFCFVVLFAWVCSLLPGFCEVSSDVLVYPSLFFKCLKHLAIIFYWNLPFPFSLNSQISFTF